MNRAGTLFLATIISAAVISFSYNQNASGHTFSGDESADFLALVEKIRAHLELVKQNTENDDLTLAGVHADRAFVSLDDHTLDEISERNHRIARDLAADLERLRNTLPETDDIQDALLQVGDIDHLLGEAITVRIDWGQMTNSTVQALVLGNVADEVLVQYSSAFDIGDTEENDDHDDRENGDPSEHDSVSNQMGTEIVDRASFQMAQLLSNRMTELFAELERSARSDSEEDIATLSAAIDALRSAINGEATVSRVAAIVHSGVHENLARVFGLEIDSSRGPGDPIVLEGRSASGSYIVEVEWIHADIGVENIFVITIMDADGNHLDGITYDIMLFHGGEHLDETHRAGQTAREQRYIFDEAGSYSLLIENIDGAGESEVVEFQMQVIPEFSLGTIAIMAAVFAGAILAGRHAGRLAA